VAPSVTPGIEKYSSLWESYFDRVWLEVSDSGLTVFLGEHRVRQIKLLSAMDSGPRRPDKGSLLRINVVRMMGRVFVSIALLLTGLSVACVGRNHYVVPEGPLPANTVMLSQVMRELSSKPGFTEAFLSRINGGERKGPALLTPTLADALRKLILGKDWQGLDRFPGWTIRAVTASVRVAARIVPNDKQTKALALRFLDLGPYAIDKAETVSLDSPSQAPGFSTDGIVVSLGAGVIYGDGPSQLANEHAESQRLADVLNRLAANSLEGTPRFQVKFQGQLASTPADLIGLLMKSGFDVAIDDARYFANFGHLHYKGQDVMAPFWISTQLAIPHSGGLFAQTRPLLVPASHAEYELHVHSQKTGGLNADVSYYFGIDGKSEWRTMDTLDQAWVLKRNAHEYLGDQAREVMRLASLLTIAYMHQHQVRPDLPFGGYYTLGVCQDGVSAVERKMTGKVTLFPNTAESALFNLPADSEINALMQEIPKDRDGVPPDPERVFGALPATNLDEVTIPGLREDLKATYTAWKAGTLKTLP
jgi:hypothetical protein